MLSEAFGFFWVCGLIIIGRVTSRLDRRVFIEFRHDPLFAGCWIRALGNKSSSSMWSSLLAMERLWKRLSAISSVKNSTRRNVPFDSSVFQNHTSAILSPTNWYSSRNLKFEKTLKFCTSQIFRLQIYLLFVSFQYSGESFGLGLLCFLQKN